MRKLAATLTFLLMLGGVPGAANADQRDQRLDGLFDILRTAPDFQTGRQIEDQIWRIWLEHPDKKTQEAVLIGMTFMRQGKRDLAELSFKRAIDRDPEYAEAWNKRATLRFLADDYAGSIADCAQVLKLEPRHFGALAGLGLMYAQLNNWEASVHWYEQALAVHPNLPAVEAGLKEARRRLDGEET